MADRPLRAATLVAFLLLAASLAVTPISNNDIWLHLKSGDLILERLAVPRVEEYTFTRAGSPLVDHEWLAQALFALVMRVTGLTGLIYLKLGLTAAALGSIYVSVRRRAVARIGGSAGGGTDAVAENAALADWSRVAATATTAVAALLLASHLFLRPHLFTFLLAAAYVSILSLAGAPEAGLRRRNLVLLVLLQILWVNLHGAFVVGILLAAIFAAAHALEKRRLTRAAILPPLLAAVSLLNPYGWRMYELVGAFSEPAFRKLIVEWQSPFRSPFVFSALFWLYVVWLVAAAASAWRAFRRRDYFAVGLVAAFALMSLTSRRHVSLLAVVTAPVVGGALASVLRRIPAKEIAGRALSWGTTAAVAGLASAVAVSGLPWPDGGWRRPGIGIGENIPVEALEVIRGENLRGRVFSTLAFGAYVTWAGWPDLTTFVDSRLEIFGGNFLRLYRRAIGQERYFRFVKQQTEIDMALLPWRQRSVEGAIGDFRTDPGWSLVYFDDLTLLYVRHSPETASLIERRAFRFVDPMRFNVPRGFDDATPLEEAEREARRAVADPPALPDRPAMNSTARIILGSALQRQGRHVEAAAEFRAALETRPDAVPAYGLLAVSLAATGDRAGARSALESLQRLFPDSEFARQMLEELDRPTAP
jgi:hypothetical protein